MDGGTVILLPISSPNNGFSKSHIHDMSSHYGHDHFYDPKKRIINEDVWKSDFKLDLHRSPPAVSLPTTLSPAPPSTSSIIPGVLTAPQTTVITTAIDTSVPPPPLPTPPSIPPPPTHVHGDHRQLNQGELMNLKNSMKQQTYSTVSSPPPTTTTIIPTSSNAVVNVNYEKEKENQLAAPDLES